MISYFVFDKIIIGGLTIYVWGLMASIGFLTALIISLKEAKRKNISQEIVWDLVLIILLGVIIGSRGCYVLWHWDEFKDNFTKIFFLWEGGLSSVGGIILAGAAGLLYARYRKLNIWKIADLLTPGIISAVIFTRIGCFLVGSHVGKITDLFWGREYFDGTIRHPVALYFTVSAVVLFLITWCLRKRLKKDGLLFLIFIACYLAVRFFIDFTRCDDLLLICENRSHGLTYSQWVFLALLFPVLKVLRKKAGTFS